MVVPTNARLQCCRQDASRRHQMSKSRTSAFIVAAAGFAVAAPLAAQTRSTVSPTTLDAAVSARPADGRAALTAALSSKESLALASRLGLSADQLHARIASLDDASAQRLSEQALAGGSNLVISTSAVIIILLLIILLTR
jgi:hypothetical protein